MIRRRHNEPSRPALPPAQARPPQTREEPARELLEQIDRWRRKLEVSIRRNPAAGLVAAAGCGLFLGWLIKR